MKSNSKEIIYLLKISKDLVLAMYCELSSFLIELASIVYFYGRLFESIMINNCNVLVTGGAGFIGSTLVNQLSATNQITIIDDLSMGKKENIDFSDNTELIVGDISKQSVLEEVFMNQQFDYIFHLGAIASVADSVKNPVRTHEVNFDSTFMMLELIKKYQKKLKRMIFASSAAVYGDEPTLPKEEDTSCIRPLTPYAIDKFSSERFVLDYYSLYDVPTSAVRFFNVYGPNQNPNSPYSGVLSILLNSYKKFSNDQSVHFTLFGDGSQTRDFIYVEDVVSALIIVSVSEESKGQVYNVGTGKETSLKMIINVLDSLLDISLPIQQDTVRSGDIEKSVSSIEKLKKLGFFPKYSLKDGLKKYIEKDF